MRFNGPEYKPELDHDRLACQHVIIRDLMLDGIWRTLGEIEEATKFPQASISAQIRHLRKERFGGYLVSKRRRGNVKNGLYEYSVSKKDETFQESSNGQFEFSLRKGS